MAIAKMLGRSIVLLALFAVGIFLILHLGRNLTPPKPKAEPAPQAAETRVIAAPIPAETPAAKPEPQASLPPVKQDPPAGSISGILKTSRGRFISTEPILFNSGLSTLREASIPKLNKIVQFLKKNPGIKLEIIGHTDNLGPEPVNQKVSAERATLVREYLVSEGIDPSRLTSKGMGSLDPIESNDTQLGRQANRRIEFLISDNEAPAPQKE